jgi:hypothetical protein
MKKQNKKLSMHLNLAEKNPSRLLNTIQDALADGPEVLTLELIGPGILFHNTALMLHEEIRKRPSGTRIHAHARTCLMDGALLLWLAADSRSMRSDTWIQLSELPEDSAFHGREDYPTSIRASEEAPSETDFRTIVSYIGEFLPVNEIAGFRLFEKDLHELGVLDDTDAVDSLTKLFNPAPLDARKEEEQDLILRSERNK